MITQPPPSAMGDDDAITDSDVDPAMRRCIVTGATKPREELLRFVVGEDRTVWPDIQEKLPGRGLWVSCDAEILATAIKKNHFAKAAKTSVKPQPELSEQVRQQLQRRVVDGLGIARRSGAVVVGFAQIEPAMQKKQLALLFIATDAGQDGRSKLANKIPAEQLFSVLSSPEQGQALGHEQLVYVGIMRGAAYAALAERLKLAAMRFSAFTAKEIIAQPPLLAHIGESLT